MSREGGSVADVFVSYSSAERAGAEAVARALEDHGFSVWWDGRLTAGESLRESIIHELNRARAVVVIWSAASVRSDWVYSEARRAADQHKLIQVRTEEAVSYTHLTLPTNREV